MPGEGEGMAQISALIPLATPALALVLQSVQLHARS